jgi:hypothetical protein
LTFVQKIVDKRNDSRKEKIEEERRLLKPLPKNNTNAVEMLAVRVTPECLIRVLKVSTSVPSRLLGQWLKAYVSPRPK